MEDDKMSIDMYQKVTQSIGYKNLILGLDFVFKDRYTINAVIPDEDVSSSDFSTDITIDTIEGFDINVTNSGNSHEFQLGDGVIGIVVPDADGLYNLPSGKKGNSLRRIFGKANKISSASANNLEEVKKLFLNLQEFLETQGNNK